MKTKDHNSQLKSNLEDTSKDLQAAKALLISKDLAMEALKKEFKAKEQEKNKVSEAPAWDLLMKLDQTASQLKETKAELKKSSKSPKKGRYGEMQLGMGSQEQQVIASEIVITNLKKSVTFGESFSTA